ncbi:hypothetical protein J4434_01675 [Candidatus Woesearchaeota archaeon]|nr:hypothetical protein [Candidatus Woesearchaeota archaeon]
MNNNLSSGFGGLGEIDEPRNIKVRVTSALEKLLEIESKCLHQFKFPYKKIISNNDINCPQSIIKEIYFPLFLQLERKIDFDIDEETINGFIFSNLFLDLDLVESSLLGVYTGALLHVLTKKNQQKGKRTILHIDGNGNAFPYLFSYAGLVDELIIQNFKGWGICQHIGCNGYINRLVVTDIVSDYALSGICDYHGEANVVVSIQNNSFGQFANYRSSYPSLRYINQLICVSCRGDESLRGLASHGKISQLICVDLIGDKVLTQCGFSSGLVEQLIIANVKGNILLGRNIHGEITKVIYGFNNRFVKTNEPYGDNEDDYRHGSHSIPEDNELVTLAQQLSGKPYQEVLRIADELYALRPKALKGGLERK